MILNQSVDGIGRKLAAVVGTHLSHTAHAVMDIYDVAAAAEPFVARDAIADKLVDLRDGDHGSRREAFP